MGGVSCHIKQHRVLRPHPASKIYAHTVKILYMGAAALYTVYTATQNEEEEEKKKRMWHKWVNGHLASLVSACGSDHTGFQNSTFILI